MGFQQIYELGRDMYINDHNTGVQQRMSIEQLHYNSKLLDSGGKESAHFHSWEVQLGFEHFLFWMYGFGTLGSIVWEILDKGLL